MSLVREEAALLGAPLFAGKKMHDLENRYRTFVFVVGTQRSRSAEDVVQRTKDAAHIAPLTVRQPSMSRDAKKSHRHYPQPRLYGFPLAPDQLVRERKLSG